MGVEVYNLGWLDLNARRAYPLSETATCRDLTGVFTLPDSFVLALYLTVDARNDPDPLSFYVSRVINTPGAIAVTVSHTDGTTVTEFGTAVVPTSGHTEYAAYEFSVTPGFRTSAGRLVVGGLGEMRSAPAGAFDFDAGGGRLDSDCVRPYLSGLTELAVDNGGGISAPLTGRIVLTAGANIRLTVSVGDTESVVRIDAIQGEGLQADCGCADDDALSPPIRSINGVLPDPSGNVDLLAGTCVSVTPEGNGVRLADTCAKPCCGSTELKRLQTDVTEVTSRMTGLTNDVNRLESVVGTMTTTVLGSRLNDQTCNPGCDP